MSTPLKPLITKAGLAAIWNATSTGVEAEIAYIGLSDQGYTPNADQTSLRGLIAKYPVAGGEKLSNSLIHLVALADDDKAFWVRAVGFFLADGTLFAVWSSTGDPLTYKPAGGDILMAYDLSLEALPADSVTIVSTPAGLNLTLAEPIAALATAMVSEQLRSFQQQERLVSQERLQEIAGHQLSILLKGVSVLERAHQDAREGLLSATVANAAGLIGEQMRSLQQEERLSGQERLQDVADNRINILRKQSSATEKDLTEAREGLLALGIANSIAVITLQTTVLKHIHGA